MVSKVAFFVELVRSVLPFNAEDDDVLACMIILHNYHFEVAETVLVDDAGAERELAPLTRRHCAEVITTACALKPSPRSDSAYWYIKNDRDTPYEVASDMPANWKTKVERLIRAMNETGLVNGIRED